MRGYPSRASPSVRMAVAALGNGSRITAQDTVPFSVWCAAQHLDNYEEALWLTVSGLGDRDTTCAIVGGIVALSSATPIPPAWLVMPYDSLDDVFSVMEAGQTGDPLATGLLIPEDDSPEAEDAFGELAGVMLTAALAQQLTNRSWRSAPEAGPFTARELPVARPALLLDVHSAASEEFAERLISFAGHYSLALLG